jgi:hypothetical protein
LTVEYREHRDVGQEVQSLECRPVHADRAASGGAQVCLALNRAMKLESVSGHGVRQAEGRLVLVQVVVVERKQMELVWRCAQRRHIRGRETPALVQAGAPRVGRSHHAGAQDRPLDLLGGNILGLESEGTHDTYALRSRRKPPDAP